MDEQLSHYIRETKSRLRAQQDVKAAFSQVRDQICADVETIVENADKGRPNIPEVDYSAVQSGSVSEQQRNAIKKAGAAIVRGVFPRSQAEDWNSELGEYIESNDYLTKAEEKAGIDKYFSALKAGRPQIYGLYWSKPQVMARQADSMAQTKRFLNRLWTYAVRWAMNSIPIRTLPMPTAPDVASPGIQLWACHPTWIPDPMNAGSTLPINAFTARFLKATGDPMIRGKPRSEPRPVNIPHPPSVPCSALFRAGPA